MIASKTDVLYNCVISHKVNVNKPPESGDRKKALSLEEALENWDKGEKENIQEIREIGERMIREGRDPEETHKTVDLIVEAIRRECEVGRRSIEAVYREVQAYKTAVQDLREQAERDSQDDEDDSAVN